MQTSAESLQDTAKDIYLPEAATLLEIQPMTQWDSYFKVALTSGKDLSYQPGQFVEVSVPGVGESPISITSSPTQKGYFEMVIRRIGNVTEVLHRMKPGDKMGIRGPFGTVFPVSDAMKGKDILFVGGGIGLVPLRSAINYVMDNRKDYGDVTILSGTRTPADRLFKDEIEKWKQRKDVIFLETVDQTSPDWKGHVGLITTLFPMLHLKGEQTVAVICGPPIMYKFVIRELRKLQVPNANIFVSLERRMKCGVGKCGHCQINGLYVCQEGPVFRYKQLFDFMEAI
jgi:sulfhydrogenase subunit gamma (sulfur reductase)